MPHTFPPDSVGLVAPQTARFAEPLALDCGRSLAEYEMVYETYGTPNADGSNAVLICHALSGDHHVAGYHAVSYTHLPEAAWRVAADALRSRGQNSPFLGWELLGQVTHTLLEGRIVYEREDIEPS